MRDYFDLHVLRQRSVYSNCSALSHDNARAEAYRAAGILIRIAEEVEKIKKIEKNKKIVLTAIKK